MSLSYSQFSRSALSPIEPSSEYIEQLRWICLDGSIQGKISRNVHVLLDPKDRLDKWDASLCRPEGIDWAVRPDWYERAVHWRGYIPKGTWGSKSIPIPTQQCLRTDAIVDNFTGAQIFSDDVYQAAVKLNTLLSLLLKYLVDVRQLRIPHPSAVNLGVFTFKYCNTRDFNVDACRLCYGMLDIVGFCLWAATVFPRDIKGQNVNKEVHDSYKWIYRSFPGPSIGYLVHLEAHRHEFGFQLCVTAGVPIYYPWFAKYEDVPHLRRFNPCVLGLDAGPVIPDRRHPFHNDFQPYDQYLQESYGLDNRQVLKPGPKPVAYVVDFVGWTRRQIRKEEKLGPLSENYYFEDRRGDGGRSLFFLKWRPQIIEDPDSEDDDPPIRKGYNPLSRDILRERYKFTCAPSHDTTMEASSYKRVLEPRKLAQPRLNYPFADNPSHNTKAPITPPVSASAGSSDQPLLEMPVAEREIPTRQHQASSIVPSPALQDWPAVSAEGIPVAEGRPDLGEVARDDVNPVFLTAGKGLDGIEMAVVEYDPQRKALDGKTREEPADARMDSPTGEEDQNRVIVLTDSENEGDDDIRMVSGPSAPIDELEDIVLLPGPPNPNAPRAMKESWRSLSNTRASFQEPPPSRMRSGPPPTNHTRAGISHARRVLQGHQESASQGRRPRARHAAEKDKRLSSKAGSRPTWRSGRPPQRQEKPLDKPLPVTRQISSNGTSQPLWSTENTGLYSASTSGNAWGERPLGSTWEPFPKVDWGLEMAKVNHDQFVQSSWSTNSGKETAQRWEDGNQGWTSNSGQGWNANPSGTDIGGWRHPLTTPQAVEPSQSAPSSSPQPFTSSTLASNSSGDSNAPSTSKPSTLEALRSKYLEGEIPYTTIKSTIDYKHTFFSASSGDRVEWSEQYLQRIILHFSDARSEVKLRLWALFTQVNGRDLVQRALIRHVPLGLPVHMDDDALFRKSHYSMSEQEARFYTPDYEPVLIPYTDDASKLWSLYKTSVAQLLERPHARALVFHGGLASRLVMALAPKIFYEVVLAGPSAQVTWHRKGYTDPRARTVTDELCKGDLDIIAGVTATPPPGKNVRPGDKPGQYSIWPPPEMFATIFKGWHGEWTQECENWFQQSWIAREGHAFLTPNRTWRQHLQRDHVEDLPKRVPKIKKEEWEEAHSDLRSIMQDKWQDQCLSQLRIPAHID